MQSVSALHESALTMAFAIGHISGCHLNPAVSFGLMVGGRCKGSGLPAYLIAQVVGALTLEFLHKDILDR
jgi:aquaporin Z